MEGLCHPLSGLEILVLRLMELTMGEGVEQPRCRWTERAPTPGYLEPIYFSTTFCIVDYVVVYFRFITDHFPKMPLVISL